MQYTPKQKAFMTATVITFVFMSAILYIVTSNQPIRFAMLSIINEDAQVIVHDNTALTIKDVFYLVPTAASIFGVSIAVSQLYFTRRL